MGKIRADQLVDIEIVDANELASTGTPSGADQTGVRDTAGNYVGTNVEACLAEIPTLVVNNSPVVAVFTAGETLTAGDWVYVSASNTVRKARANSWTTMPAIGVAMEAITSGNTGKILLAGEDGNQSGLTAGSRYFISSTVAGAIQALPPLGFGTFLQLVGIGKSSTDIVLFINRAVRRA